MKIIGIIFILYWLIGTIGMFVYNDLPSNIFEWIGNLLILVIGISLVIKNKKKQG